METWKDIPGYEGYYQASDEGRIRSVEHIDIDSIGRKAHVIPKILHMHEREGYLRVSLYKETKKATKSVHRLVAETFIDNPDKKPIINHIDGNKKNNHVANLEWVTYKENSYHAINVLKKTNRKEVIQCDKQGKMIATFESVSAAADAIGSKVQYISRVLHGGRKYAGGYVWKEKVQL